MEAALLYFALTVGFSVVGYYWEVLLKAITKNPSRPLINGPYHPVYGIGLAIAFVILSLSFNIWLKFLAVTAAIITVEYVSGLVLNKVFKLNLWNYSKRRYNLHGQICPYISIYWIAISALLTFWLYPISFVLLKPEVNLWIIAISLSIIFAHDLTRHSFKKQQQIG